MNYNYHTHTYHCHHASGTPEEYVIRAISCGIKFMGFSDHAPFVCANGTESGYRVPMNEAKAYCDEIKSLAEKYRREIEIKVGYEMEYYPEYFESMVKTAVDSGAEYLILGQHFLNDESLAPEHAIVETDSGEKLMVYVSRVIEAMKSGVFSYIAHPDVFNYRDDITVYRREMRKICAASREYGIPLEINFLGMRDNRNYPNKEFLKLAGEENAPITFGFDAHSVRDAYDGENLKKAKEAVEKYHLNYIGRPEIVHLSRGQAR